MSTPTLLLQALEETREEGVGGKRKEGEMNS